MSDNDFSFFGQDWLTKEEKMKQVQRERKMGKFVNQAKFMRSYRASKGLSLEAMGYEFGLKDPDAARQTVHEVESGRRGISARAAARLDAESLPAFIKSYLKDQKIKLYDALRASGVKGLKE